MTQKTGFKTLYKIALLSSPIMAVYGLAPIYIFEKPESIIFVRGFFFLTTAFLIIWFINIFLIQIIDAGYRFKRYALSYAITFLMIALIHFSSFSQVVIGVVPNTFPIVGFSYPFITVMAINTIILIVSNGYLIGEENREANELNKQLIITKLESENKLLMQHLHPHFLFNSLSTLKSLVNESVPEAENYILQLSEFLRFSIQSRKSPVVGLADEIDFTRGYVALQSARFPNSFFFEIDDFHLLANKKIPVFAVQGQVENAIKHNGFNPNHPLYVKVKFTDSQVSVSNNKIAKIADHISGTGLSNLDRRYKMIEEDKGIQVHEDENEFIVYLDLLD